MPTPTLPEHVYLPIIEILAEHDGNVVQAAHAAEKRGGLTVAKFKTRAYKARDLGLWGRTDEGEFWSKATPKTASNPRVPAATALPDDDIPVEELIDTMCRRYTRRVEHATAKKWRRFKVPVTGPYAIMFWGDPHIDDNGCDWVTLRSHVELARKTEAMFCVNVGDTTNNWCGRLAHLWSQTDTSESTAKKLVKWFLNDAGVPWFLWVTGNHDLWNGPVGVDALERFKPHHVTMEDWGAKVTLESPGGSEFRLHVAHDFPGHSQSSPLHGPQKEALWGDYAHLYVAGHKHNWALFGGEHSHRGTLYWLARAKGYKTIDSYAERLGFGSQGHGHSIVAVVDPSARGTGHVACFAEPFEAADYLAFKRRKAKV